MTATAPAPAPTAGPAAETATLPGLLIRNAGTRPGAVAIREKRLGRWAETTWAGYLERAARVGLALRRLGVQPGDRVAIQSLNRPEWLFTDLGVQGIGATTVGVYPTSPAAELQYLLEHSGSVVLVAEDEEQLDKFLEVRDELPSVRHVVVIDPRGVKLGDDPLVQTFAQLEASAAGDDVDDWVAPARSLDPGAPAVIVYTSGTTGPPKGAMLSSTNLVTAARAFAEVYGVDERRDVLSYLPLCHVAERLVSVADALDQGYVVHFGEGGDSFPEDLREVQPTFFLGVPRIWEKLLAAVEIRLQDAGPLKRTVARFWLRRGTAIARRRMAGRFGLAARVQYAVGWLLVYRSLREKLGLRRVRVALSGAAPIAPQVLEFFWSIGVRVREGYGQTENTAMATYTPEGRVRLGTVGVALPGVELKVADDGEILTRSAGVFLGYFRDEAATDEVLDPDGFLHTGDVGTLDGDGYLTLTDRKKDIVITAGGKNVAPSEIENRLKVSPWIREAVVIGDRRPYLTALIGVEADTVGDWAARRQIAFTTYHDLASRPEVHDLVRECVDEVNRDLAQSETIKRFALLPKELDHEDGELTATQKVKRAAIARQFADLIEGLYAR